MHDRVTGRFLGVIAVNKLQVDKMLVCKLAANDCSFSKSLKSFLNY